MGELDSEIITQRKIWNVHTNATQVNRINECWLQMKFKDHRNAERFQGLWLGKLYMLKALFAING